MSYEHSQDNLEFFESFKFDFFLKGCMEACEGIILIP